MQTLTQMREGAAERAARDPVVTLRDAEIEAYARHYLRTSPAVRDLLTFEHYLRLVLRRRGDGA